jgi:hypothetical protein
VADPPPGLAETPTSNWPFSKHDSDASDHSLHQTSYSRAMIAAIDPDGPTNRGSSDGRKVPIAARIGASLLPHAKHRLNGDAAYRRHPVDLHPAGRSTERGERCCGVSFHAAVPVSRGGLVGEHEPRTGGCQVAIATTGEQHLFVQQVGECAVGIIGRLSCTARQRD